MTSRSGWKPDDTPQVLERLKSSTLAWCGEMKSRNETICWATNHVDEGNEFISVSRTNARQADGFIAGAVEVVLDLDRVGPVCELTHDEAVDLAAALLAAVVAPLGKAK